MDNFNITVYSETSEDYCKLDLDILVLGATPQPVDVFS